MTGGPTPLLCLPGLTRSSKDFHDLATRFGRERRVIAPDYRGRGRSAHATDWTSYRVDVELSDAILLLDTLGVSQVAVVGTSRGGLIAMAMATTHKTRLAGVLLNDIGPRLEPEGLKRIAGYLGQPPAGTSWEDAVRGLKGTQAGFESLSEEEWAAFARRIYRDADGRPALDYDPALAKTFPRKEELSGPLPELWDAFDALAGLPVTVLRGALSDLLSQRTVAEMAARMPGLDAVTVSGRGHAPFLNEPESLAALDRLLSRTA
ncbi:MAG: alpha/beta fold hydrolase [Parvibaculaceae bacterium]